MNHLEYFTLITGASSGIGKEFAYCLAKRKMRLALIALPDTGLKEIAEELTRISGSEVRFLTIDLTKEHACREVLAWCQQQNIKIGYLINNAGIGHAGPFQDTGMDVYLKLMRLNMESLVGLTHALIPELKKCSGSGILNVASMASWFPIPNKVLYAASKGFVLSFSLSLREELKKYQINVSCLCPGATPTSSAVLERIKNVGPIHRLFSLNPASVANRAVTHFIKGRSLIIPNPADRLVLYFSTLIPLQLKVRFSGAIMGFK